MAIINGKQVLFSPQVNMTNVEGADVEVVQETGMSETAVMSQKAVTDELEKIVGHTCNLFNKDSDDLLSGYFATEFAENTKFRTSHPIKVESGVTYKWTVPYNDLGNNGIKVAYVDDNGDFLRNQYDEIVNQTGEWSDDTKTCVVFTAPQAGYVRVNLGKVSWLPSVMFCVADQFPSEYIPYAELIKPLVPMENLFGDVPAELLDKLTAALNAHPLSGKKATFNGDSICSGAGYTGGYAKIIAEKYGMTYENIGVGGGVIVTGQMVDDKARHSVCATIANMDSTADYAIVEGGVNDASLQVPLGTLSAGFTAALDTTTFYGAFESMCRELVTRFAGKKIGYIAVHKMTAEYRSDDEQYGYYQAAKECCEKWGVPFCDLNTEVPPLKYVEALKTAYTHNGDGWHPNEAGYRAYYVPKIIAFMERL